MEDGYGLFLLLYQLIREYRLINISYFDVALGMVEFLPLLLSVNFEQPLNLRLLFLDIVE